MDNTFTAGGKTVIIRSASFMAAMNLKNAIQRELATAGIDIDIKTLKSNTDIKLEKILSAVLQIDSSIAFNKALMDCLIKCTYDGEKITQNTFEPDEAREAYYEIVVACLKVNLAPFFKGLASKLGEVDLLKNENSPA